MGRRPGDAEGIGTGLSQNDAGDVAQLAPDFADQSLARGAVRLAVLLALAEQGFDAARGHPHKPRRTAVAAAVTRLTGFGPGGGDLLIDVEIVGGAAAEAVDQPKRVADARKPRHCLGIIGLRLGLMLRKQMKHSTGLSPAKLRKA